MESGSARNNRPSYDDRKGLGYGQLEPKYHVPKMSHDEFPYITPDNHEYEDVIEPEDLDAFVQKVNMGYHITDFMSDRKNDPHYFVAGNDKLKESIAKNSIVPLPDLYGDLDGVFGGTAGAAQQNASMPSRSSGNIQTGDPIGWVGAPPPVASGDNDNPIYHPKDIPNEEKLDKRNITDLRKLISAIYREQELAVGST